MRRWLPWRGAVLGAVLGFAGFAFEAILLWRSGIAGVELKLDGPAATLLAAIRPLLFSLIARTVTVYLVAGAVLGALADWLSRAWWTEPRKARWAVWLVEWLALLAFVCADHAIRRPALFDDLPALRRLLGVLTQSAEPWHVTVALSLWLFAHAAWVLKRAQAPARKAAFGLLALGLVGAFSVRWTSAPGVVASPRKGLTLLVGIDAFRPDRLTANGSQRVVAPNLERFLDDATLFDRAYTSIAQTEPAWQSLLTARWPHRTGVRYPLTPESRVTSLPTLPAAFARAGQGTAFFTDCSRFNFQGPASGFELREQPPRGALNFALEKLRFRAVGLFADNRLGAMWLPEMVENRALAGLYDPVGYADRLAAKVISIAQERPSLIAFHATAAHFPGDPVYPFYRRFVEQSEPLERRLRMFFSPIGAGSGGGWNRPAAEALYDELLSQADAQLGTLLDALRAQGLYEEATIVVFSDHGESFHGDHPELAGATPVHGARLSEEENRILLAVKLPASQRGQGTPKRVAELVRLVDIGPTVLELQGLPALPSAEGESFASALRGEPLRPRLLYAETGFTHASPDAFDPGHWAGAPRTFDAYSVRPDGVVETAAAAHDAILHEKDVGAFDGQTWVIRSPRKDGTTRVVCRGDCAQNEQVLADWLSSAAP